MSREKALIIGYEDPTDTEVLVKSLTLHRCLLQRNKGAGKYVG